MKITKKWNSKFGFWEYSCGCIRYQDGYDLCPTHKPNGYQSLERDAREKKNGK